MTGTGDGMTIRLLTYSLNVQADVVGARQRARHIAELLGFDGREQTRIATSVSEIARNAFRYAGGGRVEFEIEGETAPQLLVVRVCDDGPGIVHLEEVLDGTYRSTTGMGIGLIGSRPHGPLGGQLGSGKGHHGHARQALSRKRAADDAARGGKLVSRLAAMRIPPRSRGAVAQKRSCSGRSRLQEKQDKLVRWRASGGHQPRVGASTPSWTRRRRTCATPTT